MNWALPGGGFHFGNLTAPQHDFYEQSPDYAYRQLLNWMGQGNAGFNNTTFGRFAQQQQQGMWQDYQNASFANPMGGLTWTKWLEDNAPNLQQQFGSLPGYMRGENPGLFRVRRELW